MIKYTFIEVTIVKYASILNDIKSLLHKDDFVDNNRYISAYTLYKYLSDMFNPLGETLNDPDNISKVWNAWNSFIRDFSPEFEKLPSDYEKANFKIIPFLYENYNEITFRVGKVEIPSQKVCRDVGADVFYYVPQDFTSKYYDLLSPFEKEKYKDKLSKLDSFFKTEKDNFNGLFDLLDLYQEYHTYFKVDPVLNYPGLQTNMFGETIPVYFSFSDFVRVKALFSYNSFTIANSHWSDGRQPIYQFVEKYQDEILKKIPIKVSKLKGIARQCYNDSINNNSPANNQVQKVLFK